MDEINVFVDMTNTNSSRVGLSVRECPLVALIKDPTTNITLESSSKGVDIISVVGTTQIGLKTLTGSPISMVQLPVSSIGKIILK